MKVSEGNTAGPGSVEKNILGCRAGLAQDRRGKARARVSHMRLER